MNDKNSATYTHNHRYTLKNTREFLNNEYWKLKDIVDSASGLESINLNSSAVKSSPQRDRLEKLYLSAIEANLVLKSVNEAINVLPEEYQTILTYKYFKNYTLNQLGVKLSVSAKTISVYLVYALTKFARAFDNRQLVNGVKNPYFLCDSGR